MYFQRSSWRRRKRWRRRRRRVEEGVKGIGEAAVRSRGRLRSKRRRKRWRSRR